MHLWMYRYDYTYKLLMDLFCVYIKNPIQHGKMMLLSHV
jgi:hypothetical protein